ncbi:MAG: YhjD/YihY/BrkB family envelope integrity protein [bacterium]|nr:YhjD/YihY/BrkB family envelope integrity protein [bacterium]
MIQRLSRINESIEATGLGKPVVGTFRLLQILTRNLMRAQVSSLAQSLAYSTILSVVPVMAIFFAILGNITKNQAIRENIFDFISRYFIPQYANDIFTQFELLARKSVALGVIGFPLLFLAGVMLYVKVDSSINQIWDTRKERRWFRNGLAFFMTLFFGPMILVLVFSIPPYLQSLPYYQELINQALADSLVTQLLPLVVSTLGLWVLYIYIPNVKVGGKPALAGAVLAAILIQVANEALGYYFSKISKLDVIYGSLVTIPVLLIWVYALWLVVLIGAGLCYVVQHHHHRNYLIAQNVYNDESLVNNALETLLALTRSFNEGEGALELDQLHFRLGLHKRRLSYILAKLIGQGFVSVIEPSKRGQDPRYQLAQGARNIKLADLVPLFFEPKEHVELGSDLAALANLLAIHPAFEKLGLDLQQLLDNPKQIQTRLS